MQTRRCFIATLTAALRKWLPGKSWSDVTKLLGPERRTLDPAAIHASASGLATGLVHATWVIVILSTLTLASALAFPILDTTDKSR